MPELIERIAADLAEVRWPDAAEIRARARRHRGRRATVASGLVTVMAIAVALPFTVSGDDSGPRPSGWSRSHPMRLLQPEDVGPGLVSRRETGDEDRPMAAGRQQFVDRSCPASEPLNVYNALYRSQTLCCLKGIGMICGNRVTTDTAHDAQGAFTYQTTRRTRISDEGFADDLVTVIGLYNAVEPSEASRLAARAASALCVASNPPC